MKTLTNTKKLATGLLAIGFTCSTLFAGDDELAVTDTYRNFESSKMFSIPTADVIRSKDVSIEMTVGSTDIMNARGSIGLGDVAEISGSFSEVKKDFAGKGDMSSSAGLKVKVLTNKGFWPGLAFMLAKNAPTEYEKDTIDYAVNSTDFYAMLKNGGTMFGHDFAINYGLRISGTQMDNMIDSSIRTTYQYLPMIGLKIQVNESVTGMLEYEQAPSYDKKPGELEMSTQHIIQGGVRFFAKSWLAFNFGAKYCIDNGDNEEQNSGLTNAQIVGKVHLNIPTSLLWKRAAANRRL